MKTLSTSIEINASPDKIWSILTDFEVYPKWNPFIKSISGHLKVRERLVVKIQPPESKPMTFKPQVTQLKKPYTFGWLGSLFIRGLFDGHHIFEIQTISDNKCLFIHKEEFSGLLVPMLWNKLNTQTRAGFEAMNQKLKAIAEEPA